MEHLTINNQGNNISIPATWSNPITRHTPSELENARRYSFSLTGTFEGGKPWSLQTKDSGIVSYGQYQATLSSGSLFKVLSTYQKLSKTLNATSLGLYMSRVQAKDSSLRTDTKFLELLRNAGKEPVMKTAQDTVFTKLYWQPVTNEASKLGINSVLGYAILFDTKVQGGFHDILASTKAHFQNSNPREIEFLKTFLSERKNYLMNIASSKRNHGDLTTASHLEKSVDLRIGKFSALLR